MNNQFVADGEQRLLKGREAKRLETVRVKHADEWATAGFLKRIWLRLLIRLEAGDQKEQGHQPSLKTLW